MFIARRMLAGILPLICASLFFLLAPLPAFGQRVECRMPTTLELQAIEKAQHVLKQTLEAPVIQLGWKLEGQKSDQVPVSIATDANPERPLMSCWPIYDAAFELSETSPHYLSLQNAAQKGLAAEQTWMAACVKADAKDCDTKPDDVKAGERATAASRLEITATENSPYMRLTRPVPIHKLDVPGAAIAFRTPSTDDYLTDTTVCVGPWKPDVVFGAGRDVLFPFQHPPGTPFIENLCVTIVAAEDMADEVLHKIDWQQLNDALTK